ncbi:MAG TPA: RNA polymerase sigma factor [Phenylobacterium sp.]|uniref:RNA polymerase sigma factor n=1 Tax=Phenylobacterium sp. TaxID=1871053 RepID=UPI002B48362A|nr:RNA polymerase sigma factor [Phenylobacterium sp.]HKR88009.1 RNA polymerase sigma factor [Phenylobacterium sp.]
MSSGAEASDNALAQRAAAGDERAFAELVRRHKDGLYRLLRRYTGDPEDAYEAAHEAFVAAWSVLGRYDPGRPFGAWLRTIAINKARDRGRRARVRRLLFGTRPLEESEAMDVADPARAADEAVIGRQRSQKLDRAIAALPPQLKAALLLTAFEGRSQQEAGAILGVSTKTVETRVYRARKILAERLDAELRPSADKA